MRRFSLVLLFLLVRGVAIGQVDRATLVGTVIDPSGAVIPGATVAAAHRGNCSWRSG